MNVTLSVTGKIQNKYNDYSESKSIFLGTMLPVGIDASDYLLNNIRLQLEDFDLGFEQKKLRDLSPKIGSIVTFTGLVRDFEKHRDLDSLSIQHYPEMTETLLQRIVAEANSRWRLLGTTVIHRIGTLLPSQQIVLVAVASQHRNETFQAAQFIMDYLKTNATLWKRVSHGEESYWIKPRESDLRANIRWKDIDD